MTTETKIPESIEKRDQEIVAIGISFIAYFLVAGMAVALLPNNPIAMSVGVVICLSFASMALSLFYPNILTLTIPPISILTSAAVLGVMLNVILMGLKPDSHYIDIMSSLGVVGKITYLFLACIVIPITEEIYFRGLLLPIISRRFGVIVAVIVTLTLFVVNHGQWRTGLFSLCIQGAIYTWVSIRTGTPITSIITHVTYNATWFLLTFT